MEVRDGYKETEIGVIPVDWEVKRFADCADLKHGFQFRDQHFSKDGIKVTKIGNLVDGGGLDFTSVTFVPKELLTQFSNFTLQKGDVLMALTGATLGKVSTVDTDEITLQNYRVGNFFPRNNSTKEYVSCLLQSAYIQKTIKKLVNEAAQPNLGKQDFDKFLVPLPSSIQEQFAIATALSDVDALISSLEKLIAKKRDIKQGAMQQLLQPKEGWEVRNLGKVATVNMGQSPDSSRYNTKGEGLPLIQGNADIDNRKQIVRYWTSEITKTCEAGDIIMTVRAPVGAIGIATERSCIGRGVCSLKPINIEKEFLFHLLIYKEGDWKMLEQGSTFTAANSNQIVQFEVTIPESCNEQLRIANILSDMDKEMVMQEIKLEKYKQIKQGMMQNLLTGKIRLA